MKNLLFIALLITCLSSISAVSLNVTNHSFEDIVFGVDGFTCSGEFPCSGTITNDPIPGWIGDGFVGSFRPAGFRYDVTGLPDGVNVAFAHTGVTTISQVLSDNLLANTDYTLQVGIGNRNDSTGFVGYQIQLLAGGVLLAQDNNSLSPTPGSFVTSTVNFSTSSSDPNLGQALEIRLVSLGIQSNFDNVLLDAETTETAVPEPQSMFLLGLSLIFGLRVVKNS